MRIIDYLLQLTINESGRYVLYGYDVAMFAVSTLPTIARPEKTRAKQKVTGTRSSWQDYLEVDRKMPFRQAVSRATSSLKDFAERPDVTLARSLAIRADSVLSEYRILVKTGQDNPTSLELVEQVLGSAERAMEDQKDHEEFTPCYRAVQKLTLDLSRISGKTR